MEYDYRESVPIKYVLYGQFIKYNKLDEILKPYFMNHPVANWINIYIDAYQALLPIYRFTKIDNPYDITSTLINMCIHYKNYFRQRGIDSFVFLVYSPTTGASTNIRFCPEYNNKYTNRIINNKPIYDLVNKNLELISTIMPYINGCYFKLGTVEVPVIVYDMITKFRNKNINLPSLFISNSQYAFQIPSKINNCPLIFKKKNKEGLDISYIVDQETVLDKYIAEIKNQSIEHYQANQSWLSGFMTLSGIPKRDIKSLFNYKQSLKIIKSIDDVYDQATPDSLFAAANALYPERKMTKDDYNNIINRFKCIDIDYQVSMYHSMPESVEITFLKKLTDPDALFALNDKYFKDNPILLDKL